MSSHKNHTVFDIQISQLVELLHVIKGIINQTNPRGSEYRVAVDRYR